MGAVAAPVAENAVLRGGAARARILDPVLPHRPRAQTRVADTFFGANYGYYQSLLYHYFVDRPGRGALQLIVLVIAWIHAMIGMWFWLRLKPWYPRWQPLLYAAALLVPTLAIVGTLEGGREVIARSADPAWIAR